MFVFISHFEILFDNGSTEKFEILALISLISFLDDFDVFQLFL